MAVRHLTYTVIPAETRHQVATQELLRLKGSLINPTLTPDQAERIRARIIHLNQWAAGKLK